MTRSSRKSLAALLNFTACAINSALGWLAYNHGSSVYVVSVVFAIFSGVLALGNFLGYLDAKFQEEQEETYRRIYRRF